MKDNIQDIQHDAYGWVGLHLYIGAEDLEWDLGSACFLWSHGIIMWMSMKVLNTMRTNGITKNKNTRTSGHGVVWFGSTPFLGTLFLSACFRNWELYSSLGFSGKEQGIPVDR
jgi:hypothetical protein